ncbi:MAG: O-antigen ligase family protein [Actinobacteria bacterium]|nr:O-antigen ligase family protein [Actinomycetota bacterium]
MGAHLALALTPAAVPAAVKGLGVVVAASAAAGAFALPTARDRAVSAAVGLALTPILVVGELWGSEQVRHLRDHPATAVAATAAGLAVVAALAFVFRRRPSLLPLLVVAALPVRIPVATGETSNFLLVPLYLVVAGGVVAYALEELWRPSRTAVATLANGGSAPWRERSPGRLELALLAFIVLYSVQSIYSRDFEQAVKNVAFFYVPFALLLKLLTTVRWSRRLAVQCFGLAALLALVFVGIGFVEYATRHLLWNRKVIASNEFQSYFRVNSLFFDPNIYGRFLAVVMVGLAAALLWARRTRDVAVTLAALALLWAGLILTFSETSFAALLVGLAVLACLRWNPRVIGLAIGGCALVAAAVFLVGRGSVHVNASHQSLNTSSSGRATLIRGGLSMFVHRPLWGFGSGSFATVFRQRERVGSPEAATASHTTPVTVGAEQGLIGLVAYGAVLLAAFRLLLGRLEPLRGRSPPRVLVWRAFVVAAFSALVFHTLGYAAFLEDPIAWTLLAAAIVLAGEALPASETAPVETAPAAPEVASGARPR